MKNVQASCLSSNRKEKKKLRDMFSGECVSSKKYQPLDFLQRIEDEWGTYMPDTTKDRIELLKTEFKFLDIFLSLQSFKDNEPNMLQVTQKVKDLFQDAAFDITKVNQNLDRLTSSLRTKIWMIKLEIRAEYSFLPKVLVNTKDGTSIFVMKFLDAVVQNLSELLEIDDPHSLRFVPGSKEPIEELLKKLKLLRSFACFLSNWRCTQLNFFSHVLLVSGCSAMVTWLYMPGHDNRNQELALVERNSLLFYLVGMWIKPITPFIRNMFIDALQAIKSTITSGFPLNEHSAEIQAGFVETLINNLEELQTTRFPSRIDDLSCQIATLEEMLTILRSNLIHLPIQDLEFHFQDIVTVIVDVGLTVYSLYDSEEQKEDMTLGKVNQALFLDLTKSIQYLKAVIFLIIQKAFQSNLPRIHGLGYVDFLLNNLKEFQSLYFDSRASFVQNQLQVIQKELKHLQPFLKDVAEERYDRHERLQHCASLLSGKALEVEYIVDAFVRKQVPDWCLVRWLFDIIKEIILIREEVQEKKVLKFDFPLHDMLGTSTAQSSCELTNARRMTEEFVGFEDVTEKLREQLIYGPKQLDVISIVGMPGLGKTTMANKLYFDESVVSRFDIRLQCCVSQVYSRRDVLLALLSDDIGASLALGGLSTDVLADELRKILLPKRYLILLDDIWEASVWDDLRFCFYDANNGSRIILTTRQGDVVENARYISDPLHLRMFNDDESWKLLKHKVFGHKSCSSVLTNIGQEIANKCKGLPLSIVLVAGMLARAKKNEQYWKQAAMNLCTDVLSDSKAIILQSYQNLPNHLKPCFLYFAVFLEDTEINVSNLTCLWISEGFIKSREDKSLEDIAQGYLENLVRRNLVAVAKWSSGGKVKTCRIHDLLHYFCLERAQEENLVLWIKRDHTANRSSSIYSHKQLTRRRMSICSEVVNLVEWSSSSSLACSVHFSENSNTASFSLAQVSHIFYNFKFLKVLNLEFTVIDSFPTELVYLRYFAACTSQESITSSIANLWNLETLINKPMGGKLILPITIFKMVKLRHLQIYGKANFTLNAAEEVLENSKLNHLKTLSSPYFDGEKDWELILRKTPNLKKLRCSVGFCIYPGLVMGFLTRLEALTIACESSISISNFPPNLKKLTLSNFTMHWPIASKSIFAMLPNLQVLKLVASFFLKAKWEVSSDEFPQLKVLKVVDCPYFENWIVLDDSFPCLEHLVLRRCPYLKAIPSRFGDIPSLKSIEVKSCKESLAESAMVIKETQVEDMQNYDFKVFIYK